MSNIFIKGRIPQCLHQPAYTYRLSPLRSKNVCDFQRSPFHGQAIFRAKHNASKGTSAKKPTRAKFERPPPTVLKSRLHEYEAPKLSYREFWFGRVWTRFNILWAGFGLVVGGAWWYFDLWAYIVSGSSTDEGDDSSLNTYAFTPFTLVGKKTVSPTSAIITLRPPTKEESKLEEKNQQGTFDAYWNAGVWSVEIKQPQLQISRQYTPLPPLPVLGGDGDVTADKYEPEDIRILLRRDPVGELSRYLHGLRQGAEVEVRGGYVDYPLSSESKKKEAITDVVFIAGGTGIAPALQVAYSLLQLQNDNDESSVATNAERPKINMRILWANRERADCQGGSSATETTALEKGWNWLRRKAPVADPKPNLEKAEKGLIVQQLEALQNTSPSPSSGLQLETHYFVDEEGTFIQEKHVRAAIANHPPQANERGAQRPTSRRLILVSGPDGFVDYVSGPKEVRQGNELQGQIKGLLSKVDVKDWEVWKL